MRSLTVVLALLLTAPVSAQDVTEELVDAVAEAEDADSEVLRGRDPEQVQAFRDTEARYLERMEEFHHQIAQFVDDREAEEKHSLSEGYDALIDELGQRENDRRQLAIDKFESFLQRYPDAPYASHVRFRLADLYYEEDYRAWEAALEAYDRQLEEYDRLEEQGVDTLLLEEEDPGEIPSSDYHRSVALYEKIILDNRDLPPEEQYDFLDGAYYMLANLLADSRTVQFDEVRSQDVLREMVRVVPDSKWSDDAHLFMGLYKFANANTPDEIRAAIAEFQLVYDSGPDGNYYDMSTYQLAWSYYKLSEYDRALQLFVDILDRSDQEYLDRGRHSSFRPDAIKYLAISFVDMSDVQGITPAQVAENYFATLEGGDREYEWDVFKELGEILVLYYRIDDAIESYRKLQDDERWRLRPENPEFQEKIAQIYSQRLGEYELASQARQRLANTYKEGSEWWDANRTNPDALAKARSYMESSLAEVAVESRKSADELAGYQGADAPEVQAAYATAAVKFKEYLDAFPIADDYYQMQWFMADTLYRARDWDQADTEYVALISTAGQHPYGDGALTQLVQARIQRVQALNGSAEERPDTAVVERTYTSEWGNDITVYQLTPEHQALVEAIDAVLTHRFADEVDDPSLTQFGAWAERNASQLAYLAAHIYFNYNRYSDARPRLEDILQRYRMTLHSCYSGTLLVNSYIAEGDKQSTRNYSRDFILNPICPPEGAGNEDTLADILEGTTYNIAYDYVKEAQDLEASGLYEDAWARRELAAESFLSFLGEFPDSEYADEALYSAANNYQIIGQPDRAIELFERYVQTYPDSEMARGLYFRIAANYEAVFEFEKAIDYYEQLVRRFPDYNPDDLQAAHYNATYLKIGLGRHADAARGFEQYASRFPEAGDAEDVYFMAAEEWEKVGQRELQRFYEGYLRKYGMETNTAHAFTAMAGIADIYLEQGKERQYSRQLDAIDEQYLAMTASGVEVPAAARHYAARAGFRALQEQYDAFVGIEHLPNNTRNQEANSELLLTTLPEKLKEFETETRAYIARYGDQEYTSAALYLEASAYLHFAQIGLNWDCPSDYSEEMCWAFQDLWDENAGPRFKNVEDKGVNRLEVLIRKGEEAKVHNEWIQRAYELLAKVRPKDYPAQKEEILGGTDSSVSVDVVPMSVDGEILEAEPPPPPPDLSIPAVESGTEAGTPHLDDGAEGDPGEDAGEPAGEDNP